MLLSTTVSDGYYLIKRPNRSDAQSIGSSMTPPPDLADPLSLPAETFTRDVGMGLGMYYAAQQALSGFRSEKTQGLPKAFIVTGNGLPHIPPMYPKFVGLGMQKQMEFYMAELFSKSYANEDARYVLFRLVDNWSIVLIMSL